MTRKLAVFGPGADAIRFFKSALAGAKRRLNPTITLPFVFA